MLYLYKNVDKNGNVTAGGHYITVNYNPSTDKFTAFNNNKGEEEVGGNFIEFLPDDHYEYFIWGINNPNQSQDIGATSQEYSEIY